MFHWQKLAQIKDLKDYFESDFHGFSKRIEHHIHELQKSESKQLENLAILRVLEVTNGCS